MNKEKRLCPLEIDDNIYRVYYLVLFDVKSGEDDNVVLKCVENTFGYKVKSEERDMFLIGDRLGLTTAFNNGCILMQFRYNSGYGTNTIAHEAFHAFMRIAGWRGLVVTPENDEYGAYYIDWLCRTIVEHGCKHKKLGIRGGHR